jgi:branched-chain amino acid transport system permease protein
VTPRRNLVARLTEPGRELRGRIREARRQLPDFTGVVARWWQKLPTSGKWALRLVALALALVAPLNSVGRIMAPGSDWKSILFFPIGIYMLLAIGLNIVVGQAGLLDLGYVAFFAIGGYAMALLGTKQHWSFWLILPVAIILSTTAGVILGAPTLRLRGDYLAIVTLGFGEIIRITANNSNWMGGPRGVSGIPHPPSVHGVRQLSYGVLDPRPYYYLVLAAIVVVIFVVRRLERSRVGRAWAAIREDEDAAELMGVPTFKFKLWAFAIGAAIAGMAGTLFATKVIFITPDNFPLLVSILILAAVVLGGSGNMPGVILGAFVVAWLPEYFRSVSFGSTLTRFLNHVVGFSVHCAGGSCHTGHHTIANNFSDYRVLIFGATLVVMMIFRPQGLLPSRQRRAEMVEGEGGMGRLGAETPSMAQGDANE